MKKKVTKSVGASSFAPQNSLIAGLENKTAYTAKGAKSYATTLSKVLDFFGSAGSVRSRAESEVVTLFRNAYSEDKTLALKTLFYLSDVRGGQGERRLFRLCFNWLANNDRDVARKLMQHIPEFTRWDNVLESLENTPLETEAIDLLVKQLRADIKDEMPTLAGKWAPSEQASSPVTKRLAKKVRERMQFSPKTYRKMLSRLRKQIGIVERLMCSRDWTEVDFSKVPSRAALLYKEAFKRHTPELYQKFLTRVEKGEAKINAATLYPYDLVKAYLGGYSGRSGSLDRTIEAQWKALPNYLQDNPHNGLVIVDSSGSMYSGNYHGGTSTPGPRPIDVAVGLAIYFAERNVGAFNGYMMRFADRSELVNLGNGSLYDKVGQCLNGFCGSTNVQSAFDAILDTAVRNKVPAKDMPSTLYIISDMQFDQSCSRNDKTALEVAKEKYRKAGYECPSIVFWNVNAYLKDQPVQVNERGVALVSGASPSILKSVLGGKVETPYDLMMQTINTERYAVIQA